jgi:hypothetical protein
MDSKIEKLPLAEAVRLLACEKIIHSSKREFVRVGIALEEIRDKKLYRIKHGSFQEYCIKRWGFQRSYGYQLIESAKVAVQVSDMSDINARQAQALAKVPEEKRAAVLKSAGASGPITAKAITKAAAQVAKPDIILDETGYPIPEKAMRFWNRRQEVQDLLSRVSSIKSVLRVAQDDKDPMFNEVNISGSLADLERVYDGIKVAKPYAVCTSCQGKLVERCQFCGGRGVISQFKWSMVPTQVKALRGGKK